MDRKWLPLNALRAFEAAGQHLSFTAAANSLTVAQSAVSRHVIVLENFLGVALFERRPQQLVLTEAGRHILPVVSKSFDRIDQALGEVIKEKGRPKRVLKVALPTSFAYGEPIGEGRRQCDLEHALGAPFLLDDFAECLVDAVERFRDYRQNVPSRLRQHQLLRPPLEQRDAEEG